MLYTVASKILNTWIYLQDLYNEIDKSLLTEVQIRLNRFQQRFKIC